MSIKKTVSARRHTKGVQPNAHAHLAHRDDEATARNDKGVANQNGSGRQQRAVPKHVRRRDRRAIPQLQTQDRPVRRERPEGHRSSVGRRASRRSRGTKHSGDTGVPGLSADLRTGDGRRGARRETSPNGTRSRRGGTVQAPVEVGFA